MNNSVGNREGPMMWLTVSVQATKPRKLSFRPSQSANVTGLMPAYTPMDWREAPNRESIARAQRVFEGHVGMGRVEDALRLLQYRPVAAPGKRSEKMPPYVPAALKAQRAYGVIKRAAFDVGRANTAAEVEEARKSFSEALVALRAACEAAGLTGYSVTVAHEAFDMADRRVRSQRTLKSNANRT